MRRMNADGAPTSSSPTFDARNVSDDRISPEDASASAPKLVTNARAHGSVQYETTPDGDVVVVERSFDDQDHTAKTSSLDAHTNRTAPEHDAPVKKSTKVGGPSGETLPAKKRGHGHSRNLSEHFNEATNLKFAASDDVPQRLRDNQERQDPDIARSQAAASYGMHAPVPEVGQKHRRVFSGEFTNPPSAHRRINSIGNSAVIKRPSFSRTQQHQRVDSAGLEILTAAAESSREELEAATGRRPAVPMMYSSRHPWEHAQPSAPRQHVSYPHPSEYRRESHPQYPAMYGRGPPSMYSRGGPHPPPPHHPHMHAYQPQHPIPHAPPSQYFHPPPSGIARPSPYGMGSPYPPSASYYSPVHHPHSGYPTRHEHQQAPPSSSANYPVQYIRRPSPYAPPDPTENQPPQPPTAPADASSVGPTARQSSPSMQLGDERIAMDEQRNLHADRKPQWREAVPPFGEEQRFARESPVVGGHHRKLSSFSNLGAIFQSTESASVEQPNPPTKGGHHRSTSSSISFLQSLDVTNLEGNDAMFLKNLQASSGAPPSTFTGPYISRNADSKPSPPRSSSAASVATSEAPSEAESAGSGSGSKLASGGTSKRVRRKCTVGDCPNRVVQGGLCIAHGAKRKTCKHPGCTKNVKKAGLCSTHGPARKRCEADGCGKVAVQGGRCIAHGAKKKLCSVQGCTKQSILTGMCKKHHDLHKQSGSDATSDMQCKPVGAPLVAEAPKGSKPSHKPTHTRGLSIFQELGADAIGNLLSNTDTPVNAAAGGPASARARHRSTFSRDFGNIYE